MLVSVLNELKKRDKMRGLPSILSFFRNEFNKFNNTGARILNYRSTNVKFNLSVGRAFAFGMGGRGFESRPHHTKGVKNGTSSSLADARIKGIVLGR